MPCAHAPPPRPLPTKTENRSWRLPNMRGGAARSTHSTLLRRPPAHSRPHILKPTKSADGEELLSKQGMPRPQAAHAASPTRCIGLPRVRSNFRPTTRDTKGKCRAAAFATCLPCTAALLATLLAALCVLAAAPSPCILTAHTAFATCHGSDSIDLTIVPPPTSNSIGRSLGLGRSA